MVSPLHELPHLGERLGVRLWSKRDDLLPGPGGGNKIRKSSYILEHAEEVGANALVTCGGSQSNHCRVIALEAARRQWPCILVVHGDLPDPPTANFQLMRLMGARIHHCKARDIAVQMRAAMDELTSAGRTPYYVWGGGHSVQGALAYADAAEELAIQLEVEPDVIVHASGTGATQAGLAVGIARLGWSTRLVGISIARPQERADQVVNDSIRELWKHLNLKGDEPRAEVDARFLAGGYGKANPNIWQTIADFARLEGVPLDPTYTGKAAWGLSQSCEEGQISTGSRVIFWHTGGLMNLAAAAGQVPWNSEQP